MDNRISITKDFSMSRIAHGSWRLLKGGFETSTSLSQFIESLIQLGITTFDHADIYGDFECEALFGEALKANKHLRSQIELVTKCGIMPVSSKHPNTKVKNYNYTEAHITKSVDNSLQYFNTDYIDVLLLHRPSPFMHYEAVASIFSNLHKQGKVKYFGVSNFSSYEFDTLNNYCEQALITNQVEISICQLDYFQNGTNECMQQHKIPAMAWSPLAGGEIFNTKTASAKIQTIQKAIQQISEELNTTTEIIAYAWLLTHPSNIIPIIGSNKLERVITATKALSYKLTSEQWFSIYSASMGKKVP